MGSQLLVHLATLEQDYSKILLLFLSIETFSYIIYIAVSKRHPLTSINAEVSQKPVPLQLSPSVRRAHVRRVRDLTDSYACT